MSAEGSRRWGVALWLLASPAFAWVDTVVSRLPDVHQVDAKNVTDDDGESASAPLDDPSLQADDFNPGLLEDVQQLASP